MPFYLNPPNDAPSSSLSPASARPAVAVRGVDAYNVKQRNMRESFKSAPPLLNDQHSVCPRNCGIRVIDTDRFSAGQPHDEGLKGLGLQPLFEITNVHRNSPNSR